MLDEVSLIGHVAESSFDSTDVPPKQCDYCFYHDHYVLDRANFENSDLGIKCLLGLNLMCLSAIKLV